MLKHILVALCFFAAATANGQDTLPKFSVKNAGNNRYIIGWVNNFGLVKQISVQRSFDSTKGFTTILSVPDPNARQNGFVDAKAPNDHMYYRLFIVLDQGRFIFTESKKPDTLQRDPDNNVNRNGFIDKNKDSTGAVTIKPVVPKKPDFIPSFYVYTNRQGYVFINLPDAERKKYRIKFYEEDDSFLFEIRNVREAALTLDKANFLHSGWFKFELYNDEQLVEKNKFYLPKEF
jgi:hypothetical protein